MKVFWYIIATIADLIAWMFIAAIVFYPDIVHPVPGFLAAICWSGLESFLKLKYGIWAPLPNFDPDYISKESALAASILLFGEVLLRYVFLSTANGPVYISFLLGAIYLGAYGAEFYNAFFSKEDSSESIS